MIDSERLLDRLSAWTAPAAITGAAIVYATFGLGPALLVLAGTVLVGVVVLLWTSLGRLTGEASFSLEEAVSLAALSPEEERKQSILRALKDLDYERSVGKISAEDFRELSGRYRSEAKALLQSIESANAPKREQAEALLAARLQSEGLQGPTKERARGSKKKQGARGSTPPETESPAEVMGTLVCEACRTSNDADAQFCKRCGTTLGGPRTP